MVIADTLVRTQFIVRTLKGKDSIQGRKREEKGNERIVLCSKNCERELSQLHFFLILFFGFQILYSLLISILLLIDSSLLPSSDCSHFSFVCSDTPASQTNPGRWRNLWERMMGLEGKARRQVESYYFMMCPN